MRPDDMGTKRGAVVPLMPANEREVAGLYIAPDPLVTLLRFKRMVKVAERDQVAWSVRAAICDRLHMVYMQFESGGAAGNLAARIVFRDDDGPEVFPEWRIPRPVVEDFQYGLVARRQYCGRIVKVTKLRFSWFWI